MSKVVVRNVLTEEWKEYPSWHAFRIENDISQYMIRKKKFEWNTAQVTGSGAPVFVQGWQIMRVEK